VTATGQITYCRYAASTHFADDEEELALLYPTSLKQKEQKPFSGNSEQRLEEIKKSEGPSREEETEKGKPDEETLEKDSLLMSLFSKYPISDIQLMTCEELKALLAKETQERYRKRHGKDEDVDVSSLCELLDVIVV
jgi:hypothetical protein